MCCTSYHSWAAILGGLENTAQGEFSTILGDRGHTTTTTYEILPW